MKMKCLFFVLTLSSHFYNAIDAQFHPQSPCPGVFSYEGSEPEQDHWYGVILVSTDESLDGVRLHIRFDRPAELLVSWTGEVTSSDNEKFTVLNLTQKLLPGPPLSSRFMIKYNAKRGSPQLRSIHLNGRQICPPDPNFPIHTQTRPQITDSPTKRPDPAFGNSHSGGYYSQQVPSGLSGSINDWTSTTTVRYSFNENSNDYNPSRKPPYSGSNNNKPEIIEVGSNVRPNKPVSISNNGNYNSSPNNNYSNGKTESSNSNNNNNYEITTKYYKTTKSSITESYNYYEPVRPIQNSNNDNKNHYNNNNNNNKQSNITKKPNIYNSNNHQNPSSSEEGSSNNNKNNHPKPSSSSVTGSGSNSGNSNNNNSKNTNKKNTTTETGNTKKTTPQLTQSTKNTDCSGSHVNPVKNGNSQCNGGIPISTSKNGNESSGEIPGTGSSNSVQCGLVDNSITGTAAPAPLITNGQNTARGQWPWHIALYKIEGIHLTYICGGTLVTITAVITAAHCVTKKILDRPVDPDTLVVYLGKYHLYQFSDDGGVQNKQVKDVHVYPGYNSSNYLGDIAILILSSAVEYTLYVRPCCLWKFDQSVVDREGTVVGWGYDENDKVTEDLKMAKMPVVSQETCVWSYPDFFNRFTSDKTFCAGFRRGTTVCNGDSGGGMVFKQNSRWYLRGLVSITVAREGLRVCDTNHYVVFTDTAKYLEWINRYIT